jgi:hypothetical protein
LRTNTDGVQTGSKLARSACGTNRSVRAAARCEIAGVANPPVAASAPAPAAFLKNVLRSITCPSLVEAIGPNPGHIQANTRTNAGAARNRNCHDDE